MVAEPTLLANHRGPWVYDDLARFPNDGNRYELIEGSLHVSPSPVPKHQACIARIIALLSGHAPSGTTVLGAPLDVIFSSETVLQPDVLIVPLASVTERAVEGPVDLVVEVLSPSTRRHDLVTKRATFAAHGVAEYWVVDPDEPGLLVLRLDGDEYREYTHVSGDERFRHDDLDVEFSPRDLVAGFDT